MSFTTMTSPPKLPFRLQQIFPDIRNESKRERGQLVNFFGPSAPSGSACICGALDRLRAFAEDRNH